MKKTSRHFAKYIQKIVDKYVPILLLQRHTIRISPNEKDVHSYMSSAFNYPYLHAVIYYSMEERVSIIAEIEGMKGKCPEEVWGAPSGWNSALSEVLDFLHSRKGLL